MDPASENAPPQPAAPPPSGATPVQRAHSPDYRNLVHAGAFVLFAPLLGILADPRTGVRHGTWYVVAFMLFIAAWNLFILPYQASGKLIRRPGESRFSGVWLYPLALAAAFSLLPAYAALAGWAAMAGGDAAASFVGRRLPRPALPWNEKKSFAGVLGFVLGALPLLLFALWWVACPLFLKKDGVPEWPYVWTLAVLAACAGAVLESLAGPGDDNVRVPLGVGVLVWLAALGLSWATRELPARTHVQPEYLLPALAINLALGGAILALKLADRTGTAVGVLFGTLVYFFTHLPGYALFLLFVSAGCGLSRVGRSRKKELGTEEAREGQRGLGNVLANLLVPVGCCLALPLTAGEPALLAAYAGALAAAFADTASSEIGTLSRAQPFLITTLQRVPHGTDGAVSPLGLVAAVLAAVALAALAGFSGFYGLLRGEIPAPSPATDWQLAGVIVAGGVLGTLVDSLLGATLEGRVAGVNKHTVNFACTLAGALASGLGTWVLMRV